MQLTLIHSENHHFMSKKSLLILYRKLVYKLGQDFPGIRQNLVKQEHSVVYPLIYAANDFILEYVVVCKQVCIEIPSCLLK